MASLEAIRARIKARFESDPHVHLDVSLSRPRLELHNDPVLLKGVYPHIFVIEECSGGRPKTHSLQYADIVAGHIRIVELPATNG